MNIAIGCVAEPTPKYLDQAERLVKSWRWFAGRFAAADFHVCVVGEVTPEIRQRYARLDAHVHGVQRFSAAHPASNKLRFLELSALREADRAVLLDCDVVVVQEPVSLFEGEALIAKIADGATVPGPVFERLFASFGVPLPAMDWRATVTGEPCIPYFNAGVLSFSAHALGTLAPQWLDWNARLVRNLELLEGCAGFCEQASLSLAVAASRTSFTALDDAYNFPAHFQRQPLESAFARTDPVLIHYHWLAAPDGTLLRSPYPHVNRRIETFNERYLESIA